MLLFSKNKSINVKKITIFSYLSALMLSSVLQAKEEKVAPTPPMGWNSFQSYSCYIYSEVAEKNLDTFIKKYKPCGYKYFVLDNGWFGEYKLQKGTKYPAEQNARDINVNEYGFVLPSKVYFPQGFESLKKKCKKHGVKFGVHMMRGIPQKAYRLNLPIKGTPYHARDIADTKSVSSWCDYTYGVDMSKSGAQEWYDGLIRHLYDLGIEFIKYDDIVQHPDEIEAICNAIAKLPKPITLSLSPGDQVPPGSEVWKTFSRAHMLRVTSDVWDDQAGLNKCFNAWKKWGKNTLPGFWIDMDMIPFGNLQIMCPQVPNVKYDGKGYTRACELSQGQMRTLITLRALSASPLFIGGDLPTMPEFAQSLLCNKDMIRCNQNGICGTCLYEKDGIEVWQVFMKGSKTEGYVGIFNRSQVEKNYTLKATDLVKNFKVNLKNIWQKQLFKECASYDCKIPANDVIFLHFKSK